MPRFSPKLELLVLWNLSIESIPIVVAAAFIVAAAASGYAAIAFTGFSCKSCCCDCNCNREKEHFQFHLIKFFY
jgi:hypothetical protein